MSDYPNDFQSWSPERRDQYFTESAADYRARQKSPFETHNAEPTKVSTPSIVRLKCAFELRPIPIAWIWPGWLARGKMHIVGGQPGAGKTTLAMKIAATVSCGGRWPDGSEAAKGNVVIWSGEDDPCDTLIPRLEASGADLRKIYFVEDVLEGNERRPFDPAKDVEPLKRAIEAAGGAALIIVDPIVSAVAGDSHKNSETRRCLQPLVDLASGAGAALFGVTHFSKGTTGREPIERITGSLAFGALARVVCIAAKEPDAEDGTAGRRIFARAKSNIGPDDGGFTYELQLVPMREHPDIVASVAAWGEQITGSARDMLAVAESTSDDNQGTAFEESKAWLLDFLKDGPRSAKEIKSGGSEAGHKWRTIERAKQSLGVASRKSAEGSWLWTLPDGREARPPSAPRSTFKSASSKNVADLAGLAAFKEKQRFKDGQDRQTPIDQIESRQDRKDFGSGDVGGLEPPDNASAAIGDEWEGEI